jgi:precorrin-3B C17-methyltransferase
MAGLVYEVFADRKLEGVELEVVPGVTALSAAAALLGAPLMTDFAVISLSDQLVPQHTILLRRLELAVQADFVIGLYNPRGKQRRQAFDRACEIFLRHRAPGTPVGLVRAAAREGQRATVTTLAQLSQADVDMLTIVVVGSSQTLLHNGKMITPRGYADKYDLGG